MGPESKKHCWGQRRPHRRVVQNSWVTEKGGEVVVIPNTAGGSVSPSKRGPESVCYYLAVQYSWSIHTPPPERPGIRADESGGPSQGLGVFFNGGGP